MRRIVGHWIVEHDVLIVRVNDCSGALHDGTGAVPKLQRQQNIDLFSCSRGLRCRKDGL